MSYADPVCTRRPLRHATLALAANVACLCALSAPLHAQPQTAPAERAPSENMPPIEIDQALLVEGQPMGALDALRVGQPVELQLQIQHAPGASVEVSATDLGTTRWGIAARRVEPVAAPSGAATGSTRVTLTLVPWRSGSLTLPAIPLIVHDQAGEIAQVTTRPIEAIRVASRLGGDPMSAELRAARPPVPIFEVDYTPLWVGLGAGGALGLGLLGWIIARRALRQPPAPPAPRPIHVVAMERLSELGSSGMLERGEFLLFYSELSEIVRAYLGARFGFPGTELTTTEIMARLSALATWPPGLAAEDVRDLLRRCDRIKFTDTATSDVEDGDASLRRAYSIVDLTRHVPEPEPNEAPTQDDGAATEDTAPPAAVQPDTTVGAVEDVPSAAFARRLAGAAKDAAEPAPEPASPLFMPPDTHPSLFPGAPGDQKDDVAPQEAASQEVAQVIEQEEALAGEVSAAEKVDRAMRAHAERVGAESWEELSSEIRLDAIFSEIEDEEDKP